MENETWKAIPGFEGYYEVSDLGRVRSLDRDVVYLNGKVRHYNGQMIKQTINKKYNRPTIILTKDRKRHYKYPHILVAEAFIGERPEGYHVCHINGDCHDNRLINLRYDTVSQNAIDIYRYGSKRMKLSIEQVLEIRKLYATGKYKQIELAEKFNILPGNISRIVNRKSFSWLNDDGSIDDSQTAVG